MSRYEPPSAEFSLDRIADAMTRIANTLDNYMEVTLAGIEIGNAAKSGNPQLDAMLKPLTDTLERIKARRAPTS